MIVKWGHWIHRFFDPSYRAFILLRPYLGPFEPGILTRIPTKNAPHCRTCRERASGNWLLWKNSRSAGAEVMSGAVVTRSLGDIMRSRNSSVGVLWPLQWLALVLIVTTLHGSVSGGERESAEAERGFQPLFNGRDLTGWEGNLDLWKVRKGMIVGDSSGISRNEFLATTKSYGDFELRFEFRLLEGRGNSGVQFRSRRVPKSSSVEGYQADIGETYWGCLYDEHRRRKILAGAPSELDKVLDKSAWNRYTIRAVGSRVILSINGLQTVDYIEADENITREGIIALQIHSGPKMRIEFRKLRIRTFP